MTSSASELPDDFQDAAAFVEMLTAVYGDASAAEIMVSMRADRVLSYWLNPLVDAPFEAVGTPLDGMPEMRCLPRDSEFTSTDAASSGRVYIQNPSSLLAIRVLDPQPGEEVLDLAAAPGGKTIAMAVAMRNAGRIAAVEPVKGRFHRLRANVERCGVNIVAFYQRDGRGVGRAVPARFDRVLLDAPCSSQARMRWDDPSSYRHWTRRKVREASRKQKSLVMSGYAALKPGGRMVYSTCSFAPEENELVIEHLLKRTDARLLEIEALPCRTLPGLTRWGSRPLRETLAQTVRIVPDQVWDGFYLANIEKPA